MARYQIWNGTDNVITPDGRVWTPEQWRVKHPIAGVEGVKVIIGGGVINGGVLYEYTSTIERYEKAGCDFSSCETERDYLDAIEAFEDAQREAQKATVSAEERIAAALEAQVMMSLPDEETTE